jgi:hypothetical protein
VEDVWLEPSATKEEKLKVGITVRDASGKIGVKLFDVEEEEAVAESGGRK